MFTHWPDFAIPYKRYVRHDIEDRVRRYAEDEARTYEEAVSENGLRLIYEDWPDCPSSKMAPPIKWMRDELLPVGMSRSTVWRWVGEFGRKEAELRVALEVIARINPRSEIHRFLMLVRSAKFRLPEREGMIKTAAHFLRALTEIRGPPGGLKIAPRNATKGVSTW
ncbi:MAG: hypothetical protein HQL31_08425 [Planctomycetes bacterium]|nr:hypothetical protein [Planctomycetota bacterium]